MVNTPTIWKARYRLNHTEIGSSVTRRDGGYWLRNSAA